MESQDERGAPAVANEMRLDEDYNSCAEPALTRARRAARSLSGILRTHYPAFLVGLPLKRGEIPVFVYHDVEPGRFARDLEFLQANGYRTLGLDEFIASHAKKNSETGRRVLLTFDDARANFYNTALPVLEAFSAHATLFAPTYWMNASPGRPADGELFMSWDQVRECAQSGLVDVQSHAHRHALVFTSARLIDFATPRTLARYDIYDWPMRHTCDSDQLGRPVLGSPIYTATPLLSAQTRFVENAELTSDCTQLVERCGGSRFFARKDWAVRLRRFHASRSAGLPGHFMPESTFRGLVASELERSRAEFQLHLGYAPRYLAYPWMLGSDLSLTLAKSNGIHAAFGVALDYRRARNRHLPVRAFGRLKADWLRLLPGTGRASFLSIAGRKLTGLSRIQHLAH
jgi:peptidoglycan/xylan/chitin deacetylase (PgdA/CDA1 family)